MLLKLSHGRDALELRVAADATLADVKASVAERTGVLARNLTLIHKGKKLADDKACLGSFGVVDGARLMVLAGGSSAASTGAAALSAARAAKQPAAPVVAAALPASAAASRQAAWAKTGSVALRDAGLQDVPADVWAVGAATRVLDLSGNPALRGVGEQLGSLHALTRLQLCGCGLLAENIAWSALCRLSSLTTLALDHNALTALPDSLGSLRSLRQLSASHNALRSLPASVGQLSALTVLTLDGNALTALPDELGSCAELEELHVRRNALTALPPALGAGCLRLAVLSADGNRLPAAGIPPALLRAPALHTLSLHENPVTIEQLRELDGWGELDERRRAKANKAISARVLDASASFDEGADASAFRKF